MGLGAVRRGGVAWGCKGVGANACSDEYAKRYQQRPVARSCPSARRFTHRIYCSSGLASAERPLIRHRLTAEMSVAILMPGNAFITCAKRSGRAATTASR